MTVHPPPAIFTDEEFERMIRSGAFAGMGRVELRRGRLHRRSPQYAEHMRAKLAVWRALDV